MKVCFSCCQVEDDDGPLVEGGGAPVAPSPEPTPAAEAPAREPEEEGPPRGAPSGLSFGLTGGPEEFVQARRTAWNLSLIHI